MPFSVVCVGVFPATSVKWFCGLLCSWIVCSVGIIQVVSVAILCVTANLINLSSIFDAAGFSAKQAFYQISKIHVTCGSFDRKVWLPLKRDSTLNPKSATTGQTNRHSRTPSEAGKVIHISYLHSASDIKNKLRVHCVCWSHMNTLSVGIFFWISKLCKIKFAIGYMYMYE